MELAPDQALYTPLAQHNNEIMLLGSQVNNMYDQARINIDPMLQPARVRVPLSTGKWKMFHGVPLKPSKRYTQIKRVITSTPHDHVEAKDIYRARVKFCGLSCDECWAMFDEKIFPLDASNLPHVSLNTPYMKLLKTLCNHPTNNMPWFTQHTQPKIFILCHR